MKDDARQIAAQIIAMAHDQGFALAGVCPAEPTDWGGEYREWIATNKHAEMEYLARNVELREDIRKLLDGARSVVMVGDVYEKRGATKRRSDRATKGRIARYARGEDYHLVMKKKLHAICDSLRDRFQNDQFRAFVDTAPVLEREHAVRCGLGWVGKHTLLIHPALGSWMFLGGFVTTLELEPPASQNTVPDHCGTCTRCIEACPTGAITPYSVEATKCISYLTIEHRSPIDPDRHEAMGDWIFGCDVCQEVCPHNSERHGATNSPSHEGMGEESRPEYETKRPGFDLLEILGWTEDDRRAAFARSAMKRAKLDMFRRNALIAAANALREESNPGLLARIRAIESDQSESGLTRSTARQVLDSLEPYTGRRQ